MIDTPLSQIIRRVIVYIAMTASVLILSTVLVFAMLGYRYNQQRNTIVQGGLVQFISEPTGANIRVGDIQLANQTRSKITLNPGDYKVTMSLNGYHDWLKNVSVKAGTVLWLNSARLIPNDLKTTSVANFASIGSIVTQERGQNIVILQDASQAKFTLIKSNEDEPELRTIELPASTYANEPNQVFRLIRQSGDNRHILMTQTVGANTRWIVADLNKPENTYTIASSGSEDVRDVQLDPSSYSRAYVQYANGTIRRLDIGSNKVSEPIVTNTESFSLTSKGSLFYVAKPFSDRPNVTQTGYVSAGKEVARLLDTMETAEPVRVAAGQYFDNFYFITSVGAVSTLKEYNNFPESDSSNEVTTVTTRKIRTPEPVQLLSFKANGRLIALQQSSTQSIYDFDLSKQTDVNLGGVSPNGTKAIEWLDSFHFWDDRAGNATHYEFDGTNKHVLTSVAPGYSAAYSQNNEYFYSVGKTDTGFNLQRTKLTTD